MKNLKIVFSLAILLALSFQSFAQKRGAHNGFHLIEKFKSELNLTEAQTQQVDELHASFKEEMDALHEQEFESRKESREAMKNLMLEYKGSLENILTEEQNKVLAQQIEEGKKHFRKRKHKRHHLDDATKAKLEAYKKENILPVMQEQRMKLEEEISADDQQLLAELRPKFKAHHEQMKSIKNAEGDRKAKKEQFKAHKESMKADHEQLKALSEKYEDQIDALFAEVEDQQKQWKEDMGAIMGASKKGEKHAKRGHGKRHRGKGGKHMKMMRKSHFLLLDPNAPAEEAEAILTQEDIQVYPNPAISNSTVQYNINVAGVYQVELRDDRGNVLKVLDEGFKEAGEYTLNVDLGSVDGGVYFVALAGNAGFVSKKLIVTKN